MTKECTDFLIKLQFQLEKPKSCDLSKPIKGKLTSFPTNNRLETAVQLSILANISFYSSFTIGQEHLDQI